MKVERTHCAGPSVARRSWRVAELASVRYGRAQYNQCTRQFRILACHLSLRGRNSADPSGVCGLHIQVKQQRYRELLPHYKSNMAPVRVMLGVVVSCLLLGLTRAQGCEKDVDFEGEVLFERMTFFSDAVVSGDVKSIGNGREASVRLNCIYKTDGSRDEREIKVFQKDCPSSDLEKGMTYLMFLEKTLGGYALRYTPFEADIISEAAAVCGIERTAFDNVDDDTCPEPEGPTSCIQYPLPTTAGKPDPEATSKPEPETPKPDDVNVVVGGQGATPEPEGDGTNSATTNFLSCALSLLSFVMSLLML